MVALRGKVSGGSAPATPGTSGSGIDRLGGEVWDVQEVGEVWDVHVVGEVGAVGDVGEVGVGDLEAVGTISGSITWLALSRLRLIRLKTAAAASLADVTGGAPAAG